MTSYIERERNWVSNNNIHTGSVVTINPSRFNENDLRGWDNSWCVEMPRTARTLKVVRIASNSDYNSASGIFLSDGYWYPFYCLDVE